MVMRLVVVVAVLLCVGPMVAAKSNALTLRASICERSDKTLFAVRGACPTGSVATRGIAGVNIFDQLWVGSSGMDTGSSSYPDAKAALLSAQRSGVKVFRFFAGLWGPNQAYWVTNRTTFWKEFDRLMDDIDATGMYCIPSIGYEDWNLVANKVTPGLNETANDAIRNTSSVAYTLNMEYFHQITTRYKNRSSVLFWELGNELNLKVNLPPPWCGPTKTTGTEPCFNTKEMVAYTAALVATIRSIDPVRPVSSGFSKARNSAWHSEYCSNPNSEHNDPGCAGGFYGVDTEEQWRNISAEQQQAVDIFSAHHYAPNSDRNKCYFNKNPASPDCVYNASLISVMAELAAANGQMAYIGEYGGPGPNFTGPTVPDQDFVANVLDLQVASVASVASAASAASVASVAKAEEAHLAYHHVGHVDHVDHGGAETGAAAPIGLTTVWAWACPTHRTDMVCIWPNSTEPKEQGSGRMVKMLADANARMAHAPRTSS